MFPPAALLHILFGGEKAGQAAGDVLTGAHRHWIFPHPIAVVVISWPIRTVNDPSSAQGKPCHPGVSAIRVTGRRAHHSPSIHRNI
jgi:hypothetical protein